MPYAEVAPLRKWTFPRDEGWYQDKRLEEGFHRARRFFMCGCVVSPRAGKVQGIDCLREQEMMDVLYWIQDNPVLTGMLYAGGMTAIVVALLVATKGPRR